MDWILTFMEDWGYTALLLTMILENMNIPIPSEIVLGFAGFLVSRGIMTYWGAVAVGTLAGIIGSLASYAIGYYGGRPLLLQYGNKFWLSHKRLKQANDWFDRYGGIAIFTGRLLPGIRTFISLPAGMAKYPLKPFILYTLLGTIPWTMLLIWAGRTLGDQWENILLYDTELMIVSAIVLLLAFLVYKYKQR